MLSDGEILSEATKMQPQIPVWLTYLWQRRVDHRRLGLVLGAGVSYNADIPMWEELVRRLAEAANVPADRMRLHKEARIPETYLAQILFSKYSEQLNSSAKAKEDKNKLHHINSSWKEQIRECLYRDVKGKEFGEIRDGHPYLKDLARLVCDSRFAVTFNFDDIVDEAVVNHVEEVNEKDAGSFVGVPEIIYFPKVETRKNAPVIYHINGSLPRDELRRSSERVILTEDAFADILLSPNSSEAEFVLNQFSIRTFLLLGISLGDNSLKNLLRSSARRSPANHHFIVVHERDDSPRTPEQRKDIFDVNLEVYNLISIFLTTVEIAAFIRILNQKTGRHFDEALGGLVQKEMIDRKYYLVGSVAAGKSSALDRLRCFTTYEEFGGRVPAEMYKNDSAITSEEQKVIDDFLFPQLIAKNNNMYRDHSGIRVTDRACLDLFAFSRGEKAEILRKAIELKGWLARRSASNPLQSGQIFFLKASEDALEERLARRGTKRREHDNGITRYDTKTLVKQERDLAQIYKMRGKRVIDTTRFSLDETVKEIARTILLRPYEPFNFAKRLEEIIDKGGKL